MRTFSSYGPLNTNLHYYAPREALIDYVYQQLVGTEADLGGHYITIWAPRQTGKTWILQQVMKRITKHNSLDTVYVTLQGAANETTLEGIWKRFTDQLSAWYGKAFPAVSSWREFTDLLKESTLDQPLVLVIDEFDSLHEQHIRDFVREFRIIHSVRNSQVTNAEKEDVYLLHGLALIGVRAVLGVENSSGSPFNIQRSIHIPNLTPEEVRGMFQWYQEESAQTMEPAVVDAIITEFRGQPGLTCWMGELLTERYNKHNATITIEDFRFAYTRAIQSLPNNNILNIISKAGEEPYQSIVLELFRTETTMDFRYDNREINYLYLNGVIDEEIDEENNSIVRFASPFVQKRLFGAFSTNLFHSSARLYDPFTDLSETITETSLNLRNVLRLYEQYLHVNSFWLFKEAPRRADLRLFEAIYHFNLYAYLSRFLERRGGQVLPEFPTGNGKIDLIIRYAGQRYGLEVKSFVDAYEYQQAIVQTARYGKQLGLTEMDLVFFIEAIDDANRTKLETIAVDQETGLTVRPTFVVTGTP
ncbi:MAG: AAA-like domain-containing protein [Caldilineaceae bacterium]|nr:AAA-like domain-containing protein [Caldilineaceae bacterium]